MVIFGSGQNTDVHIEVCYDILLTLKVKFIEVVFYDVLRSML